MVISNDSKALRVYEDPLDLIKEDTTKNKVPIQKNTTKNFIQSNSVIPNVIHRYLTCYKIARVVNSIQMEIEQINNSKPVIHDFIPNVLELLNLLKYEELIKGPNKET